MMAWMLLSYVLFGISCLVFLILTVIVTVGGAYDLRYLFKSLKEEVADETDDGRVNPD